MANITGTIAITSGATMYSSVINTNWQTIARAINYATDPALSSTGLNSDNYANSQLRWSNISQSAISSQHISDSTLHGDKLMAGVIHSGELPTYNQGSDNVPIIGIYGASATASGGYKFALIRSNFLFSTGVTDPVYYMTIAFESAVHGPANYTAAPILVGGAYEYESSHTSSVNDTNIFDTDVTNNANWGPRQPIAVSIASNSALVALPHYAGGAALTASYSGNVNLLFLGPCGTGA